MRQRNPRGPALATAGAITAAAACLGAMAVTPAFRHPAPAGPASVPAATAVTAALTRQVSPRAEVTANPDCTLKVPKDPRTAQGLATPYVLESAGQSCAETDPNLAAFVQAVILDPATGALQVYNPVVSDANTAATPPPVPVLPAGAVVVIWTGFNGNVLKLVGPGHGEFVNFAQQAYDNSPAFFTAIRAAEAAGLVTVPPLGTASDGMACPSTRDFSLVDQDQSDNVVVKYGAPFNVVNGSDDASLNGRVDPALGCATWKVPLTSATGTSTAGPLEEEQARVGQQAPVALVPSLDPFVLDGGQPSLTLQNLYRAQVGQPPSAGGNDTTAYCQNLAGTGEPRLKLDAAVEALSPPPAVGALGVNLALHLAARFQATWANLTCQALTGMPSPITVTAVNAQGLATAAAYK